METVRTESIATLDGHQYGGHLRLPAAGRGAGVLLIQEIFGVNEYVKDVARRLADVGYVVLAPDLFWRIEPNVAFDSSDPANLEPAMAMAGKWDSDLGLADLAAALQHLDDLEEVTGAVGVIGFCFGGTQAFRVAQELEPACAVGYYGSGVADMVDNVRTITCPTLLHFGGDDPYIPEESVHQVKAAAAENNHITVHVHEGAGHAFDNSFAPHFSHPEAAQKAWTETTSFLYMHLGGPGLGA